jgi:stress response protein YsnF
MTQDNIRTSTSFAALTICVALAAGCSHKGGSGYYGTYGGSTYYDTTRGETAQGAATTPGTAEAGTAGMTAAGTNEVVIPLYQEKVTIGKQESDSTVHLKKSVVTETVNQPVELRRETLTIDRTTGAGNVATTAPSQGQPFQEQDFTIQLHREDPLIQKQVVQSGQVVALRKESTEQINIQSQARHEDIAVDKGNVPGVTVSEAVGGATSPGEESRGAAPSTQTSTSGTITDMKSLAPTTDPQSVAGHHVQLSNIKVQEIVNPYVIAIGSDTDSTRVYAYLHQPIQNLKVGDKVNLSGTIRQPSTVTSVTAAAGGEGSQRLNAQPFFLEAQSAQLSNE